MRSKPFLASAMSLALVSCATMNNGPSAESMPQVSFSTGYTLEQVKASINAEIAKVNTAANDYTKKSRGKRFEQTAFDSTLIATATATVAAAFFTAGASLIGGLGIGAGSLATYRSYYDADGEGLAYIRAAHALACVSTAAAPLQYADTSSVTNKLEELDAAIAQARKSAALLTGAQSAAGTQGGSAASDAISAAEAARKTLELEVTGYSMAPTTIAQSYNTITSYVDSKMHRTSPVYATAQQSITDSIATDAVANAAEARTKLTQAVKSDAQAQAAAGTTPAAGPTPVSAAPGSAGSSAPVTTQPAAPTLVQQNSAAVTNLVEVTEEALSSVPLPPYTTLIQSVTKCADGFSG